MRMLIVGLQPGAQDGAAHGALSRVTVQPDRFFSLMAKPLSEIGKKIFVATSVQQTP